MEGASTSSPAGQALQEAASSFLSTLKNKFRTSQGAVNLVVNEVNKLTNLYLEFLKEVLSKKCAMQDGYLTLEKIFLDIDSVRGQSVFEGVQSQPYLDSFISHRSSDNKPFGVTQVIFDSKFVFSRGIPRRVPTDFEFFPPFLPQLEQLLNCKDVLYCVDNPRTSEDGVFRSVTDGYFYKYHYVVRKHGNKVLTFYIHVDDVEFADPCKSKTKKHKLRLFYWCLGNIYPELRSSLKAINLLGIARYEVAKKYGNEEIVKHFVKDMSDLAEGVTLVVNGEKRLFHGILQFVAADIPAAANIGGMKESHFALRPCRICMCTNFELCNTFQEDEQLLRRLEEHNKYVDEVEAGSTVPVKHVALNLDGSNFVDVEEEEEDLTQESGQGPIFADHADPSVNYGINKRSVLADAPGFDVTKCLPYDIMHVLFEGIGEQVCRLMLKDMCLKVKKPQDPPQPRRQKESRQQDAEVEPKLSLKYVNKIFQEACDFGHLHGSKLSPIEAPHLKNKLKQSASQMIVLIHILPVIAFGNISTEKLDVLGQLIKLISLAMKFEFTEKDVLDLGASVVTFGENFVKCYPDHKTLKLHSLKHLPMQMYLHGPLRQQACFRFEAMHRTFTRLVDVINNMKCIEFSLACRHLNERNLDIMNSRRDGTYLYPGDSVRKCEANQLSTLPEKDLILQSFPEFDEKVEVATVNSFERHERTWKKDVVFPLCNTETNSASTSTFGIIVKIYLINNEMVFLFNHLKVNYLPTFHGFEIQSRDNSKLVCLKFSAVNLPVPVTRFSVHFGPNRTRSFLVCGSSGDIVA